MDLGRERFLANALKASTYFSWFVVAAFCALVIHAHFFQAIFPSNTGAGRIERYAMSWVLCLILLAYLSWLSWERGHSPLKLRLFNLIAWLVCGADWFFFASAFGWVLATLGGLASVKAQVMLLQNQNPAV